MKIQSTGLAQRIILSSAAIGLMIGAMVSIVSCSPSGSADEAIKSSRFEYRSIGPRSLTAEVFYPPGWKASDKRPAIVFFQGGAFKSGGTLQFRDQAFYFSRRGLVTLRVEYRDSNRDRVNPDTGVKDAISAMRWVRKNADALGIDKDRIVSSGASAGGFLAAAVATIDNFHSDDDDLGISPRPDLMILFNPLLSFVDFDRAAEFGIDAELALRISPLQNMSAELPPTLIMIGSEDSFLAQNREFKANADKLGVKATLEVADGQPHSYFNYPPWKEKTTFLADSFLVSQGYLKLEPRVNLPHLFEKSWRD